jgi:hypothetical protein
MAFLTKQDIDKADDSKDEIVTVPEWGGDVKLKVMSGADLDKFENLLQDPEKQKDGGLRARLVASCLVDEKGKRLYSEAEVYMLGKKNGAVLTRLFQKCLELNRVGQAEAEAEAENFDGDQSEGSTTD